MTSKREGARVTRVQLAEAADLVDETMEQIRLLAHNLRPPVLDSFGLNPSLAGFCEDFAQRTGLKIHYEGVDLPALSDTSQISYYRFLQEGLNNIAKHSKAGCVCLSLQKIVHTIQLTIQDDGQGFDLMETAAVDGTRKGLGLTSMKNRAQLSGGCCKIESSFGKGTIVRASLPIGSGVGFQGQEEID